MNKESYFTRWYREQNNPKNIAFLQELKQRCELARSPQAFIWLRWHDIMRLRDIAGLGTGKFKKGKAKKMVVAVVLGYIERAVADMVAGKLEVD